MRPPDHPVVLITGASSGIGAAVALEYARRGADLVLTARRSDRLESLAGEIQSMGRKALPIACDVTADGDLERVAARAREDLGRIDVVLANAGFGVGGWMHKLELDDYRRQLETNVFGVLRTIYATREDLIASRGCLGIVGSVNSYVALHGVSAYCMSKHAIRALACSLRHELAPHGVAVVHIAPGFVDSEIRKVDNSGAYRADAREPVPAWLAMPTDRAARKIVRALGTRRREAVITGHGKLLVFLERHTPGLLAAAVYRFGVKARKGVVRAALDRNSDEPIA